VKRKLTFATFGLALALTLVAGAFAQESSKRVAAVPPAKIPVTVLEAGKAIQIETLPPEARAQLERVRTAAQGLINQSDPGAQRIKVSVNCTWGPPLRCTITVEW